MLFTKTKNESRKALIKHQKKNTFSTESRKKNLKQSVSSTESQEDKTKDKNNGCFRPEVDKP